MSQPTETFGSLAWPWEDGCQGLLSGLWGPVGGLVEVDRRLVGRYSCD